MSWESAGLLSGRLWVQTPTRPTIRVFKKLVRSCWLWCKILSEFRWSHHWASMLSCWPCLLHPSFHWSNQRDIKEPTLMFEKSWGCFPSVVACLILHTLYIMGQVCYRKLINGLDSGCWCPPCMLTSELTVNMLTYKKDTCVVLRSHPRHFLMFFISNIKLTQTLPFFFRYQGKSQLTLTWQLWPLYVWRLIMISDHVWIPCRYGPGRIAFKSCN